jgi:DNA-binding NarL/FixJ family response regulator
VDLIYLVDQGMTNKEIASTTKLPLDLITKKLNEMFKKLKVKNKTELLQWWKKGQLNSGP